MGSDEERLILDLEKRIWEALAAGDPAADAALLSATFLGVYETGFSDKADHVAQLKTGATVARYALHDVRFMRLAADVMLIAYRADYRRTASNAPAESMYVSSIWRKEADGRWLNVFSQDTAKGDRRPV